MENNIPNNDIMQEAERLARALDDFDAKSQGRINEIADLLKSGASVDAETLVASAAELQNIAQAGAILQQRAQLVGQHTAGETGEGIVEVDDETNLYARPSEGGEEVLTQSEASADEAIEDDESHAEFLDARNPRHVATADDIAARFDDADEQTYTQELAPEREVEQVPVEPMVGIVSEQAPAYPVPEAAPAPAEEELDQERGSVLDNLHPQQVAPAEKPTFADTQLPEWARHDDEANQQAVDAFFLGDQAGQQGQSGSIFIPRGDAGATYEADMQAAPVDQAPIEAASDGAAYGVEDIPVAPDYDETQAAGFDGAFDPSLQVQPDAAGFVQPAENQFAVEPAGVFDGQLPGDEASAPVEGGQNEADAPVAEEPEKEGWFARRARKKKEREERAAAEAAAAQASLEAAADASWAAAEQPDAMRVTAEQPAAEFAVEQPAAEFATEQPAAEGAFGEAQPAAKVNEAVFPQAAAASLSPEFIAEFEKAVAAAKESGEHLDLNEFIAQARTMIDGAAGAGQVDATGQVQPFSADEPLVQEQAPEQAAQASTESEKLSWSERRKQRKAAKQAEKDASKADEASEPAATGQAGEQPAGGEVLGDMATFRNVYTSRDGHMALYEDGEGHVTAVNMHKMQ